MAATTGQSGFGVRLQRAKGATWGDVGEIKKLGGIQLSRDTIEATHTQSPSGYREFLGGLRDGGEVEATIALVPSAAANTPYQLLVNDFNNNVAVNYRILFPDGATNWSFSGYLTKLDDDTPIDDEMTSALTFKVSGVPSLNATS